VIFDRHHHLPLFCSPRHQRLNFIEILVKNFENLPFLYELDPLLYELDRGLSIESGDGITAWEASNNPAA